MIRWKLLRLSKGSLSVPNPPRPSRHGHGVRDFFCSLTSTKLIVKLPYEPSVKDLNLVVKWRDANAATPFSSFCSPRSPNRTGFGMGRLKPRPTFSPHSSRYGTSRRASVARAHVVVLMGHPGSR